MDTLRIRGFRPGDEEAVRRLAGQAFDEFRGDYADWDAFLARLDRVGDLAAHGEMIVATVGDRVAGAVAYVGPGKRKQDFFPAEWPVVRMLVVAPECRGRGIGRALMEECIRRAERDGAPLLALNAGAVMRAAVALYRDLGFEYQREAPPVMGVPHGVYVKRLAGARA